MSKGNHRLVSALESSVRDENPFVKYHESVGRNVLHQALGFNSYSSNGFSGTFYPPSSSSIIDRRFLLEATAVFTCTNTTIGDSLSLSAPRALPLSAILKTCQISINGHPLESRPQEMRSILLHSNNESRWRSKFWGLSPSQPDLYSHYGKMPARRPFQNTTATDTYSDFGGTVVTASFGFQTVNRSPFQEDQYLSSSYEVSRASFPYSSTTDSATDRTYVFTEPLLNELCVEEDPMGLTNVREIQIDVTFDADLTKMWSSPHAITGLAATIASVQPRLLITYVEPNDVAKLPTNLLIPYSKYEIKSTNVGNLAVGGTSSFNFNNITVGQVPKRMWIYAKQKNSAHTYADADAFATITSLNMVVGTKSGIFAGCTKQMLYQLSIQNGVEMNWNQWSKRKGSLFCCDFSRNIGGLVPGAVGNLSISFNVGLRNDAYSDFGDNQNTGANTLDFDCYCVMEMVGEISIQASNVSTNLGTSMSDVNEASANEEHHAGMEEGHGFHGGKIHWKSLWKHAKKGTTSASHIAQRLNEAGLVKNDKLSRALTTQAVVRDIVNQPQGSGMLFA